MGDLLGQGLLYGKEYTITRLGSHCTCKIPVPTQSLCPTFPFDLRECIGNDVFQGSLVNLSGGKTPGPVSPGWVGIQPVGGLLFQQYILPGQATSGHTPIHMDDGKGSWFFDYKFD